MRARLYFASACLLYFGVACSSASNGSSTPTASTRPTATVEASATPPSSPDFPTPRPGALILRNGTLISGTGADPVPNGYVVVEGDRILSVGSGEPPVSRGAMVIDARGGAIMPGLIDSHVHVARDTFAGEPGTIEPGGLMPWLSAGMTTLRDVGTPPGAFPQVKQVADGETAAHNAPRVVWAGPLVTAVGGYPFPVPRYASVGEAVASADEARQLVSSLADNGAGVIKLGLEQGYYGNLGWPLLPLDVVQAITDTAHTHGLRVTAHVTSLDEVRLALDGGVDDLAHAPLEALPDGMIQEMLSRGTGMATTATVWGLASASAQAAANAKRYAEAGGIVSVATDYGCCGQAAGLAPYLQEMQFLQAAGMTPTQLIMAATRSGAIMSNVGRDVGTLETGKIADIIIIRGDPLSDLQALNNVSVVVQGGQVVVDRG